ncbi:MAG: DUF72 domain-containing protein [Candidatus Helarchaeota archaeon]|nr:DUF72 domain-containing protein [Candidatus Helarchaeota archaeon]
MKELFIGCGGWSYWQVDREYRSSDDRLADYATVFNFVEVNNTFYQVPSIEDVKSWRICVAKDFQFAVKCSRQISHQNPLISIESNFQAMGKMLEICKVLDAVALVIQTPPKFAPTSQNLQFADTFFSHYDDSPVELVWEPRGPGWTVGSAKEELRKVLTRHNVTHCSDISRTMPLHSANISYTRVFGLGEKNQWEFDDSEIHVLHERARELPRTTYVTFHTQRQTHDAARMKAFDETGRLINTTGKYEVNSMMVAIDEYRKYPITKQELLAAHGWKIIDLKNNNRIRATKILSNLPDIVYKTKKDLKSQIEKIFRGTGQKKLEDLLV